MKERIEAVQQGFWRLLAVGAAVVLIGVPLRDDGATTEALKELEAFRAGFDRGQLESTLLGHASAQGTLHLSRVAEAVEGPGTPALKAAASAPPLAPRAQVELETLEQIHALSGSSSRITIGSVEPASLARGLAWRLARHAPADPEGEDATGNYTLLEVELTGASSSEADLKLERDVVEARELLAKERKRVKLAEAAHEKAAGLYEARIKWKAPWKSIVRANEQRRETKSELDAAQAALSAARGRYQELAEKASEFAGRKGLHPERGVARATLESAGKRLELTIPVRLLPREVAVPGLTGADFAVVRQRGLWDELSSLSVADAIDQLERRFSWHYAHVEVAGFKVGGMTVLQLAPLSLLLLLLSVRRRSEGVGESYNPFGLAGFDALPRVGLGVTALNLAVLVLLPLAGSLLCAWSLLQLDRLPLLPVLCGAGVVVLGVLCHLSLKELSELRDAVTRSHSLPPPPVRDAG